MLDRLQFRFERRFMADNFDVYIYEKDKHGISVALPIPMQRIEEKDAVLQPQPCLVLMSEECQGLMDELWNTGFRPTEGTGSAGALAATQKHLEDMRKIAFDLLEKE